MTYSFQNCRLTDQNVRLVVTKLLEEDPKAIITCPNKRTLQVKTFGQSSLNTWELRDGGERWMRGYMKLLKSSECRPTN